MNQALLSMWSHVNSENLHQNPITMVGSDFRQEHHVLLSYIEYYNGARTHLSPNKDAPIPRAVQAAGRILPRQFSADYTITMVGFDFRQGQHIYSWFQSSELEFVANSLGQLFQYLVVFFQQTTKRLSWHNFYPLKPLHIRYADLCQPI